MAIVEIRDLYKRFGSVKDVNGLSFDVEAGRVTGFLGPNGAGKSTTLRALLGLVRPSGGTATIAGRLYEAHGGRGTARIRVALPFSRACRTDLLEGEGDELRVCDGAIEVAYGPWELITIALRV